MFLELTKNIFQKFLNLIYKQKCLICGCSKTNDLLCKTCSKQLHYLSGFAQRICLEKKVYCAFKYEGIIKKLIHLLKFSHKKCCAKLLAELLFRYYKKLNLNENYIIIYPPVYFLKSSSRGYDHMKIITKEFAKLLNLKVENNLIKKIKPTTPQYKSKNRRTNIKGSFMINEKLVDNYKDKPLLLIDDIITTGATIEEIISILALSNINNITCLTISNAKKYS